MIEPPLKILLVEDDEDDFVLTRQLLGDVAQQRYQLDWIPDLGQALSSALSGAYDACLLDYRLGSGDGLAWLRAAVDQGCQVPVILLTGQGDRDIDLAAMEAGAADYLVKDRLTPEILERSIRYAIQQRRAEDQRARLLAEQAAREQAEAAQESLRQSEERLRLTLDRLNLAMEAAELVSWDWDVKTDEVVWSPHDRVLGCAPGRSCRSYRAWMDCIHPEDRPHVESQLRSAMQTPGRDCQWEYRILRADATVCWVTAKGRFYRDEEGRPVRMLGVISDITSRKKIEEALAERTRELARSNAELEQFASIIAHDLRSPLNALKLTFGGFRQLPGVHQDQEAREMLELMSSSIDNMSALIARVLEYSRAGTTPPAVEACDLEELVDEALLRLQPLLGEAGASVTRGPLPTVPADRSQLGQLFQNLIENAVKYRRQEPPRVHVTAQASGAAWIISVRDNGIGIPAPDVQSLFEFGQRLHGKDSRYSGTGIGLAVCKRIVLRHGGRIWVESTPGRGSTFFFTLPRKQPAERRLMATSSRS